MRYRVEVDQTRSYSVEVEADTVEDALDAAALRVETGLPMPISSWVRATDAVELEPVT